MNTASIIIIVTIVILAGAAVWSIIAARKKGKSSCAGCSGDCANCNISR
ncbi:MAG: FeoB-associated Cys-rich membrane protein [Lachnospiraceae bacterium]|nr:FeoB-associated Cys-rich membrane protein [Lachnospiraceae bacterium]